MTQRDKDETQDMLAGTRKLLSDSLERLARSKRILNYLEIHTGLSARAADGVGQ